ncbi:hypothetical protein DENSPDRAFT_333169 [Dentipellis sp. KUC8613]|nr:hypothetical protein DENSPDRAFT_333169 [Dentipellis sp. KUC8613]
MFDLLSDISSRRKAGLSVEFDHVDRTHGCASCLVKPLSAYDPCSCKKCVSIFIFLTSRDTNTSLYVATGSLTCSSRPLLPVEVINCADLRSPHAQPPIASRRRNPRCLRCHRRRGLCIFPRPTTRRHGGASCSSHRRRGPRVTGSRWLVGRMRAGVRWLRAFCIEIYGDMSRMPWNSFV